MQQQHWDSRPHVLLLPSAVSKAPNVKGPVSLSTRAHTFTWDTNVIAPAGCMGAQLQPEDERGMIVGEGAAEVDELEWVRREVMKMFKGREGFIYNSTLEE